VTNFIAKWYTLQSYYLSRKSDSQNMLDASDTEVAPAVSIRCIDSTNTKIISLAASVYLEQWPWQYEHEYGIRSHEEMAAMISKCFCQPRGHVNCTYVAQDSSDGLDTFVGTVSLVETDLASRPHLGPWIACLWVRPDRRNRGIARMLFNAALDDLAKTGKTRVYLWCNEQTRTMYERWGCNLLEVIRDHDAAVCRANKYVFTIDVPSGPPTTAQCSSELLSLYAFADQYAKLATEW
jgi:GNAT superfamily N-acetyltransferase